MVPLVVLFVRILKLLEKPIWRNRYQDISTLRIMQMIQKCTQVSNSVSTI